MSRWVIASQLLNTTQLNILKTMVHKAPAANIDEWTVDDALRAIALYGGWKPAPRRPPGWLVLMRGFIKMLEAEDVLNKMRPQEIV